MAISVGSVSVDVTPNTRTFASDLKAKLKGVTANVAVTGDTTRLRASLDALTKNRTAVIRAKADTGAASAALDKAARDRTSTIRTRTSGLPSVSGIALAIATLGPALVPITAAVGGLGAALAAPLAVAGGGLTVGALIAGFAVKDTEKQQKKITELAKKVSAAQTALNAAQTSASASSSITNANARRRADQAVASALAAANAATTPAAAAAARRRVTAAQASLANTLATSQARSSVRIAAAQKKVTDATAAYNAALKGLSPAQVKFLDAQSKLKASFKGLISGAGASVFTPIVTGMDLLSKVLPNVAPLIIGVAGGVNTLLGDLNEAATGNGFKNFMNAFGASAGATIVTFGRTFGNFAKGLFGLFKAFSPLSKDLAGGLSGMAKSFAEWGSNVGKTKGFQSFLAYVRDVGPKVAATFGAIIKALVRIGIALAPIGALALGGLKVLSDVIQHIPVPVLTALAGAIIATMVALKGYQVFKAASGGLTSLSASINGLRGADSQLSKTAVGIRGLAGVGGIGLLTASATTSNKALGILGSAGGGALLGFAVGGPVGAAVGAGAGALLGLATQASKAKDAFARSKPILADYVASLDAVTGAATAATRSDVFLALQKSKAIGAGKQFGLSSKTLVDATLGDPKALALYAKAVNDFQKERDAFIASGGMGDTSPASLAEKQHLADLSVAFDRLTDAVGGNSAKFKADTIIQRDQRLAVLDLGVALKGLPPRAITEIGLKGFPTTKQQISELASKYNLTRAEIKTLIKVSGVPDSVREIERVKRALDRLKPKVIKVSVQGPLAPVSPFSPGIHVEGAGATGAIVNRPTVALIGENGPERLTPLDQTPGNSPLSQGGSTGPQFSDIKVYAQDMNDFLRQMQMRSRQAGVGGVPA